jgi:class 3 adenylate cyclase
MRFSRRITLSILALVAGTSVVGAAIARLQVRRAEADGVASVFELEARAIRERQALRLDATRQAIGQLDTNSFLFGALVEEDWTDLYANAEYELRALRSIDAHFLDAKGRPVARPGTTPSALARSIDANALPAADEPLDQPPRPICVIEDAALVEALRQPVVDVTTGEPVGWIVAAWPWTWPGRGEDPTATDTLYAVSVGGKVALPPDQPGREWLAEALRTTMDDGTELVDPDGEPFLLRSFPIDGALREPARFIVLRSLAASRRAERRTNAFFLGTAVVAVGAGAAVSQLMGRSLSRPVQRLGEAARAIGHGDYSVRVALSGAEEFEALGSTFNDMAQGLSMRDRYRNVLDAVADPAVAEELVSGELDLKGRTVDAGILFCDIRGFTATTESMTPDEVITMLNAHMSAMCDIVYRHGGMVDKFVGDLVMAVWGAPKSSPDDAVRMARCALEMQAERTRLNDAGGRPIRIGIGIAFGPVVAGCMGSASRVNYTVLGARVNLASRLCSAAKAGEVVADGPVRERLDAGITATALEPFPVKGFSEPVVAYVLRTAE